jgi:hypothetical protein
MQYALHRIIGHPPHPYPTLPPQLPNLQPSMKCPPPLPSTADLQNLTMTIVKTIVLLAIVSTCTIASPMPIAPPQCRRVGMNGGCPVIDCLAENCLKSGCVDCLDECESVNCAAVDVECMSEGLVCRCVCGGIAPITFEGENV